MPPFENPNHSGRLVILPHVENAFDEVYLTDAPPGAHERALIGSNINVYHVPEYGDQVLKSAYNYPFLFKSDGTPWLEANSYIYHLIINKHQQDRPTDEARRQAPILIEYQAFCEKNGIDWKDFSGKRPAHRPYGRYFNHLKTLPGLTSTGINARTKVIYDFYLHASKYWIDLNIELVDSTTPYKRYVNSRNGKIPVEGLKRSMTVRTAPASSVPEGFVRDDGEDLTPLNNDQLSKLHIAITSREFSVQDRLIIELAVETGARKQTLLTIRLKHLIGFTEDKLKRNGKYKLHIGPGSGIDTKGGKNHAIYISKKLAEKLLIWGSCATAKKRQRKFLTNFSTHHPDLPLPAEENIYLFLSDQANCYYMAQDDLRYPILKTVPRGQVTGTFKKRLARLMGNSLPKDFTFHWLRATFAYQTWQHLQIGIEKKYLKYGEDISIIQSLLGHSDRETTENYLKLFKMIIDTFESQNSYEEWLFETVREDESVNVS